MFVVFRL